MLTIVDKSVVHKTRRERLFNQALHDSRDHGDTVDRSLIARLSCLPSLFIRIMIGSFHWEGNASHWTEVECVCQRC